ncbi:MAG: SoxR reducing system RseC family protein [Candidatus Saganbacteria bacterium]|nr:SoxR reducing system RseC family protein [Candidatus Saganbacteria bacterium]
MREQGIIDKVVEGKIVEVAFKRTEACEKCRACHAIEEGLVGVEAVNDIGAKIGDMVEIEIPSQELIKGSLILFLVPVLFMIVGYLVGAEFTSFLGLSNLSEIFGIIFALIFLAISFFISSWYDKNVRQRQALQAHIIKVIPSE